MRVKNLKKRILFPRQATVAYIDSFLSAVEKARSLADAELILDFSETTELGSLSICFLCGLIDLARGKNNRIKIVLPRNKNGSKIVKKIKILAKEPSGSRIKIEGKTIQVRRIDGANSATLQEMIGIFEFNLSLPAPAKASLSVLLNELLTNAIDHSGQKFCYVCMGIWGRSQNIDVAFLDFGVGIPQSIRTRYPQYTTDSDAMRAILNQALTVRQDRMGGKGYELIQNILRENEGRLHIFSGYAKVVLKYDKREYSYKKSRSAFVGTCVDIQYHLKGAGLYEVLSEAEEEYF